MYPLLPLDKLYNSWSARVPQLFRVLSFKLCSIKMIQALFLISMILGVVLAASEDCDCFQSFLVNGTTTVNQLTSDGKVAPMTVINMTPIFAPCGTDWTIMRETLTVIATDCDQIQTRDEPLLTSMGATPKTTCFVTVSYHSTIYVKS